MSLALSVLDLTPRQSGRSVGEALASTVELARRIEPLGFRRFWVSEHHGVQALVSTSPPVLLSHIASVTTMLRVGSGGVLLPNHTPLEVAEQFATLDVLFPGRIDLGIGRSPGTLDDAAVRALRRGRALDSEDDYRRDLVELLRYLEGADPVVPLPDRAGEPAPWLLASSAASGRLAAELGLPIALAHHLRPQHTEAALGAYREHFRPSRWLATPYVLLCVLAICAESEERVVTLTGPIDVLRAALFARSPAPMPSPAEAADHPFSEEQRQMLDAANAQQAFGTPDAVLAKLTRLARSTGADELMLVAPIYDLAERVGSLELIATLNNQP